MTSQDVGVESAEFHGSDTQAFGFETRSNGANQAAFYGIGLQQDESAV
jgi:hypothetical protein